jgi:hypothetical protein
MKPQSQHAQEDRLLEFVYGELPPLEARAVESHVEGCTRCSELLNGIRGVRTTMKQLHTEPAPDAGLESLLAYAHQAARNAAAGPEPKTTWWRRWLIPVFGVAAVCAFGLLSIQVSKSVNLSPQLSATREAKSEEVAAYKDERAPAPPPAENAPAAPVAPQPVASQKLDEGYAAKEESRKKMSKSGLAVMPKADWSNTGAGTGFARPDDANAEPAQEKKSADKVARSYEYNQRDAMTQVGPLTKSKPTRMNSISEPTPAPGAAQAVTEDAPEAAVDGLVADAELKQEAAAQGSLRIGGGRSGGSAPANKTVDSSAGDDFDDLLGAKSSLARREQQPARQQAYAPPPPPAAAAAPAPSPSRPSVSTAAPSTPAKSPEAKGKSRALSSSELSRLAEAAMRSGDRVQEAQYLTQALEAGATGSERLGLLNRLCDAEFSQGRRQAAIEACTLVLKEGPRSGAAQVASKRMRRESPEADDAKPLAGSKASNRAGPAEQEAPASSAPAQAQ